MGDDSGDNYETRESNELTGMKQVMQIKMRLMK